MPWKHQVQGTSSLVTSSWRNGGRCNNLCSLLFICCPGIAFDMGLQVVQVLAHSPYTLFLYCNGTDRLRGGCLLQELCKTGRESERFVAGWSQVGARLSHLANLLRTVGLNRSNGMLCSISTCCSGQVQVPAVEVQVYENTLCSAHPLEACILSSSQWARHRAWAHGSTSDKYIKVSFTAGQINFVPGAQGAVRGETFHREM